MKTITVFTLVLFCVSLTLAQDTPKNSLHGYVEVETEVANAKATPQIKTYLTFAGKSKTGLYCWAQTSRTYSQVYCGPTYSPKSWLQVGGAVGVETAKNPFRSAAFVWIGKGKFSNLLVVEKGGSGSWYRNLASFQVQKNFTLSVSTQRFSGTGPRADFSIPKTNFSVGGEYHFSTQTARFGVRYSF